MENAQKSKSSTPLVNDRPLGRYCPEVLSYNLVIKKVFYPYLKRDSLVTILYKLIERGVILERWSQLRVLVISIIVLVLLGILFLLLKMGPYFQVLLHFLEEIIGPFIIAVIISYLLNPIVNLLQQRALPRSLAVILIYSIFICSLIILVVNMLPVFQKQLSSMVHNLPNWNEQLKAMIREYTDNSKDLLPISINQGIERALTRLEQGIGIGIGNLVGDIGNTLNSLLLLFIVPFLAFYMMKDAQAIEKFFMTLVPQGKRRTTVRLLRDIDQALGNYIRGQLLVCLIVGVLAYVGYLIIDLPYPLLFAAVVSVFNVIPYLGPIFGAIPALVVGLTISKEMVLGIVVVNFIVQMLEGNIISPQIVGRSVRMHPLLIIFALLVGGEMGGVMGLILAVPLFVIAKVIIEHLVQHHVHNKV